MDVGFVYQEIIELLRLMWELEFTVFGIEVTMQAVILWALFAGVIIAFIKR